MATLISTAEPSTSMSTPPRRMHPLRIIAVTTAIVTITAVAGATWQHVMSERGRSATPPPGELIEIGGRDLHLHVSGDGTGPAIVLEAALFGFSAQWAWVQQEFATRHTVVTYDRPGMGWSDPDPQGVDPDRIAGDLHTALSRRGLQEPWILVGHSTGGLIVRTFADRYPDEVAGVVLVDATHPEQLKGPMGPIVGQAIRLLGRTGVLRASGLLAREAAGLPVDNLAEAMPILNSTRHIEGAAREMAALSSFGRAAAHAGDLGSTPLTVITAGNQPPEWHALQRDLTSLSSFSRHVVVPDAAHQAFATDRGHARPLRTRWRGWQATSRLSARPWRSQYTALLSSTYLGGRARWRLALRQQTPVS